MSYSKLLKDNWGKNIVIIIRIIIPIEKLKPQRNNLMYLYLVVRNIVNNLTKIKILIGKYDVNLTWMSFTYATHHKKDGSWGY